MRCYCTGRAWRAACEACVVAGESLEDELADAADLAELAARRRQRWPYLADDDGPAIDTVAEAREVAHG